MPNTVQDLETNFSYSDPAVLGAMLQQIATVPYGKQREKALHVLLAELTPEQTNLLFDIYANNNYDSDTMLNALGLLLQTHGWQNIDKIRQFQEAAGLDFWNNYPQYLQQNPESIQFLYSQYNDDELYKKENVQLVTKCEACAGVQTSIYTGEQNDKNRFAQSQRPSPQNHLNDIPLANSLDSPRIPLLGDTLNHPRRPRPSIYDLDPSIRMGFPPSSSSNNEGPSLEEINRILDLVNQLRRNSQVNTDNDKNRFAQSQKPALQNHRSNIPSVHNVDNPLIASLAETLNHPRRPRPSIYDLDPSIRMGFPPSSSNNNEGPSLEEINRILDLVNQLRKDSQVNTDSVNRKIDRLEKVLEENSRSASGS